MADGIEYIETFKVVSSEVLCGIDPGAVFNDVLESLQAGDIEAALVHVEGTSYPRYKALFELLGPDLPAAAAQMGRVTEAASAGDMVELTLERETEAGLQLFFIYLLRGHDGVWRIETM